MISIKNDLTKDKIEVYEQIDKETLEISKKVAEYQEQLYISLENKYGKENLLKERQVRKILKQTDGGILYSLLTIVMITIAFLGVNGSPNGYIIGKVGLLAANLVCFMVVLSVSIRAIYEIIVMLKVNKLKSRIG